MIHLRTVLLLVLLTGVSCQFNAELPPDAVITCKDRSECPKGLACSLRLGRCLPIGGDKAAPVLIKSSITPALTSRNKKIAISFTTNETLLEAPTLSFRTATLISREPEGDGERFVYSFETAADQPEGVLNVEVAMTDSSGNDGNASVGSLRIDATNPVAFLGSVQIQPAVARPGDSVLVQIAFSEPLAAAATLTLPDGTIVQSLGDSAGALAAFQVTIATNTADGLLPMLLGTTSDLAGNTAAPVSIGSVRVDTQAPVVTRLQVEGGLTVRSETVGFNTFTVVASADAGVGDEVSRFSLRFLGQPVPCTDTAREKRCDIQVTASMPEGPASVELLVADRAGNSATASTSIRLDYSPPAIVPGTTQVTFVPSAAAAIQGISALGAGSKAVISFSLTEGTSEPLTVRLAGLPLTCVSTGLTHACTYQHACAALPDGAHPLVVTMVDAVGNRFSDMVATLPSVVTDCVPPALAVDTPDKVIWHRAPWGAPWATGGVSARLELAADALSEATATVRVGTDRGAGVLNVIGTSPVSRGSLSSIPVFDGFDHRQVYVQAVDAAGNASAMLAVRDVALTANLTGTQPDAGPGLWFVDPREDRLGIDGGIRFVGPTRSSTSIWHEFIDSPSTRAEAELVAMTNNQAFLFGGLSSFDRATGAVIYQADTGRWSRKTDGAPEGRIRHRLAALKSGDVLLFGGLDRLNTVLADSRLYSADTQSWLALPGTQPAARSNHQMLTLDTGEVLLFGGLSATNVPLSSTWLFNPDTLMWSALANPQPPERSGHQMVLLLTGEVLLFGGQGSSQTLNDSWLFNPVSRTWSAVAGAQPGARSGHRMVRLRSGNVLLVGGTTTAGDWLFNATTRAWSQVPGAVPVRIGGELVLAGSRALVFGGRDASNALLNGSFRFDETLGQWQANAGAQPPARVNHRMVALASGQVLLTGGQRSAGFIEDSWLFDANTVTWVQKSGLNPAGLTVVVGTSSGRFTMFRHNGIQVEPWRFDVASLRWLPGPVQGAPPRMPGSVTGLPNEEVLAFGGFDVGEDPPPIDRCDRYQPTPGQWVSVTSVRPPARNNHAATRLSTDQVMVVGGFGIDANSNGIFLSDTWLYTVAGGWVEVGMNPLPPVNSHHLLPLPGGSALVVGGYSTGNILQSSYRYTPGSGWSATGGATPQGRWGSEAVALSSGNVLLYGGSREVGPAFNDSWLFDTATSSWSLIASAVPLPTAGRMTALDNGKALLLANERAWLFDESRRTWTLLFLNDRPNPFGLRPAFDRDRTALRSVGVYDDSAQALFRVNGGAAGLMGSVRFRDVGIDPAQVKSIAPRVTAGADGFTLDDTSPLNGFSLDIYEKSNTAPPFINCASNASAGASAPATVTCSRPLSRSSEFAALRLRPTGFSNGKTVALTVTEATIEIAYRLP